LSFDEFLVDRARSRQQGKHDKKTGSFHTSTLSG